MNYKDIPKKFKPKNRKPRTRVNHWIKISPIRLIDEKGENQGVVETPQALRMAREKGLDLIEIAPNAKPPVCRIMNFGKFQYQQSKKEKEQKTKQKQTEIKSVRITPRAGKHDIDFKAKQTEKFLNKGNKVKVDMILKGREKALFNTAKEKLNDFLNSFETEIELDQEIKKQPRGFSVVIRKKT